MGIYYVFVLALQKFIEKKNMAKQLNAPDHFISIRID